MNNARRLFLLGGTLGLAALASGCVGPASIAAHTYPESVSSVLISKDHQKIVFIGKTYHYVFDAPVELIKTLELPFPDKISGTLPGFYVDKKGVVSGSYLLQVDNNLSESERNDATAAGFKPNAVGQLALTGKMSGMRYRSKESEKDTVAHKLNRKYDTVITYEPSTGEKVTESLLTPIIATSDGMFLLFNIALTPVLIPLANSKNAEPCFPYCVNAEKK